MYVFNFTLLEFRKSRLNIATLPKRHNMTYPLSSGTAIRAVDHNDLWKITSNVLGTSNLGYGLNFIQSDSVNRNARVTHASWERLVNDINVAYEHITNVPSYISTATLNTNSVITAAFQNNVSTTLDYVVANRYVCAPEQYQKDENGDVITTNCVSTRTEVWGVAGVNAIDHTVNIQWPTAPVANHFFNTGGEVVWSPGYNLSVVDTLLNIGIDATWGQFIDQVAAELVATPLKYRRSDFVRHLPGTEITNLETGSTPFWSTSTGTISIVMDVYKYPDEKKLDFTVTFANSDVGDLVVSPTVGIWLLTS
jgi:hypothetical protein